MFLVESNDTKFAAGRGPRTEGGDPAVGFPWFSPLKNSSEFSAGLFGLRCSTKNIRKTHGRRGLGLDIAKCLETLDQFLLDGACSENFFSFRGLEDDLTCLVRFCVFLGSCVFLKGPFVQLFLVQLMK